MMRGELKRTAFAPTEPKPAKGPRMRRCKVCRSLFAPRSITHKACGAGCAVVVAEAERKAQERKSDKVRKLALKTRQDWLREAQAAVNAWIRKRDMADGCISCDKPSTWNGQWHASHYLSVGASPSTRFSEDNIHKACSICNNHLSGNIRAYRPKLIAKIGIEAVELLEGPHPIRKYDIDELKSIKAEYIRRVKEMSLSDSS